MKKLSDWFLLILILLFFAIPLCGLAIADNPCLWPKSNSSCLFSLLKR